MIVVDRYNSVTVGVYRTLAVVKFDGISNRDEFEAAFPMPPKPAEPAPYPYELFLRVLVRVPTDAGITEVPANFWFYPDKK